MCSESFLYIQATLEDISISQMERLRFLIAGPLSHKQSVAKVRIVSGLSLPLSSFSAYFWLANSLPRSKQTSSANISRFVTSNSPSRRENYHIWGQFTLNYHAAANSCHPEWETGYTETITFVHMIMKTHARAATFSHKYGHYDLVGIAC